VSSQPHHHHTHQSAYSDALLIDTSQSIPVRVLDGTIRPSTTLTFTFHSSAFHPFTFIGRLWPILHDHLKELSGTI
jgi:hypothetical protein